MYDHTHSKKDTVMPLIIFNDFPIGLVYSRIFRTIDVLNYINVLVLFFLSNNIKTNINVVIELQFRFFLIYNI
jgi:hypothetical protein